MSYQTAITIKTAIDNIRKSYYVLPSIQREFVWGTEQIETLFDSLMRDYPISTFLFWKIDKKRAKDFQFYSFLKKYHKKSSRHNTPIDHDLLGAEDLIALLDGQQRMTSMYLALTGSYSEKTPYSRKDSTTSYPEKKLYLNLLTQSGDIEKEYDFRFLTQEEATKPEQGYFWFECSTILEISDMAKASMFLMKNKLMDTSIYKESESEFAINTLNKFFNVIHQKGTISYYLEESETLDKVLQIFIRVNSGGTKLSYSDLLLSIATAQWHEKDAREIVHAFVDEINTIGDGFEFNKDIVLKSCLVLSDLDVKFKVDNFNRENMSIIENNWDKISEAIKSSVELIAKLGYNKENLIANNAIIPIAYFVYKNSFSSEIVHSDKRSEDRESIKIWIAKVLLKGVFGGTPDNIYPTMRVLIKSNLARFPLLEIIEHYKGKPKSIIFSDDDIDAILKLTYGKDKTYCALSLLYSGLNYNFKYHQDHIHPKSFFTKRHLRSKSVSEEQIALFEDNFNLLPNLQLLEATQNTQKSNEYFDEWLNKTCSTKESKESYLKQQNIPLDAPLEFEQFLTFIERRKTALKDKLKSILQ